MDWLFGWITDWIKQGLIDAITGQFTGIFESVNNQVTDVAAQVGQTPQGWNGGVFSMIQTLSETVVLPIAGMILTFVLVYELIQMILEKNNMHEFDTFNIFKWVFKTFVATYLLTNCFTIVMAVFDVAQTVVANSAGIINGNLDVAAFHRRLQRADGKHPADVEMDDHMGKRRQPAQRQHRQAVERRFSCSFHSPTPYAGKLLIASV